MVAQIDQDDAEQQQEQDDGEKNETVPRHALFITQRAQAANAAGGQIRDEPWVGSHRSAEIAGEGDG